MDTDRHVNTTSGFSLFPLQDTYQRTMGNHIHFACWRDDIRTLQKLKSTNLTLFKRPGAFGASALHVAVFRGSIKCVKFILEHTDESFSDVDETFGQGITAMKIAQDTQQRSILKLFIDVQDKEVNGLVELVSELKFFYALPQSDVRPCSDPETDAKMAKVVERLCKRNINAPVNHTAPSFCTPLYLCVVMNYVKGVKKLLRKGANIGTTALVDENLLCVAAFFGFYKLIPVLIDAGFSISHEPGAYTPLVIAAQYGNLPCVKAITTRKEYDPTTAGAHRALHEAAHYGYFHVISTLMKAGASEKYIDSEGSLRVTLHIAAAYDHRAVVERLLALGADPFCSNKYYGPSCTCTALSFAAQFDCFNVVKPLIDAGLSPTEPCEDDDHVAPVIEANMKGFCTFLKAVVDCGYDPNSLGPQRCSLLEHALHIRFYQKREKMPLTISPVHLERLIGIGCRVSRSNGPSGLMPIHLAAQFNDVPAIEILLKHEVSVDVRTDSEKCETAIYRASLCNSFEAVEVLAKAGADLNAASSDEQYPLHAAVVRGTLNLCRKLLDLGANPNTEGKFGMTALHFAAGCDRVDIIRLLVSRGGEMSAIYDSTPTKVRKCNILLQAFPQIPYPAPKAEYFYKTPLHVAVECEALNAIKKLIQLGADIDAKNTGRTPLYYAASLGMKSIVSDLIAAGASVEKMTVDGSTPLHVAIIEGHMDVVEKLVKSGCNTTQPMLQMGDPSSPDLTPFQLAALFCRPEILHILHANTPNIDVNELSPDHLSPLHLALLRPEGLTILDNGQVQRGLHFDTPEKEVLFARNQQLTVEFLIKHCKVNAMDEEGVTPLDMAVLFDLESIISMLVKAGGEMGEKIKDKNELRRHIEDLNRKMSSMTLKVAGMQSEIMDLQEFKAQTIQQMKDMEESMQRISSVQMFTTGIICLCLHVCVHVLILFVCVYVCLCVLYVGMYVFMCVVCRHVCVYVCLCVVYVGMCACMCAATHLRLNNNACIYIQCFHPFV